MSIRDSLNKPAVGGSIVAGIVVAALAFVYFSGVGRRPTVMLYYTADNGKSYFQAPAQASPITYHGQPAYEVALFSCNGGEKFVGYMKRYPDSMRKAVDNAYRNRSPLPMAGYDVKGPADSDWSTVGGSSPAGGRTADVIQLVTCPDGNGATQFYAAY